MDFELRAAREKLEREQRERKQRAKAKFDREAKAKAEAARRRDAIDAAQRSRRLDAARSQFEAEQRLEESLVAGDGIAFSRTLEALPYEGGYGDKIKLPPSCFKELSDLGALDKGPMFFRLSRVDDSAAGPAVSDADGAAAAAKKETHSGVLEFTAREGSVELPPHVWSNLFAIDGGSVPDVTLVDVCYVRLQKGTYAKLQPEGPGFSDLPNHKAVLETALRRHATLSQDDIISVNYGQVSYKLRVLELRPTASVSVLETDIEVDIEGADVVSVGDNERNQHVLNPLAPGKAEEGVVEEGKFNYYKFSINDIIAETIATGLLNVEVAVEAITGEGDTNIYISKHPLIFPTQHHHEWSSHDIGSKVLILKAKDQSSVEGTYSIGVFGFKGLAKYRISVSLKEQSLQKVGQHTDVSLQSNVDTVECQNCKHHISSRTIMLHEAYCFRNNFICKHDGCGVVLKKESAADHVHCGKCGDAFSQGQIEKHMKVFHEPLHCPCGVVLEKKEMVHHQSSTCSLRLIMCRFCGDMVQAGTTAVDARDRLRGLSEHESVCGSRTAPCDSCGRSVMLKDMDIHLIAVHQKS